LPLHSLANIHHYSPPIQWIITIIIVNYCKSRWTNLISCNLATSCCCTLISVLTSCLLIVWSTVTTLFNLLWSPVTRVYRVLICSVSSPTLLWRLLKSKSYFCHYTRHIKLTILLFLQTVNSQSFPDKKSALDSCSTMGARGSDKFDEGKF